MVPPSFDIQFWYSLSMTEVTISFRIDKKLHEQVKEQDEVNWSAILRKMIQQKLEELEKIEELKKKMK